MGFFGYILGYLILITVLMCTVTIIFIYFNIQKVKDLGSDEVDDKYSIIITEMVTLISLIILVTVLYYNQ